MIKIAVVDVGIGNLRSVQRAIEAAADVPAEVVRTSDPNFLRGADRVVVPGQSGFGDCARALGDSGMLSAIQEVARSGKPLLGICLGLQVLFEGSEEAEGVPGMGWFRGKVRKLATAPGIKIPHMGWNQLELHGTPHPLLLAAGGEGASVYFVHSFHAVPDDPEVLLASVGHGPNRVTAAVGKDNVFATQFHPEKSQANGLSLLRTFLRDA